ncbi:MAG: hypothetical protein AAF621_04950 [Pseudomonadota bacterium]
MKYIIVSALIISSIGLASCNTIGGLGRDISEAGDKLDKAAGWSQGQLNDASEWAEDTTTTENDPYMADNDPYNNMDY